MAKAILFLADGVEEMEAVTTTDILRRGQVDVCLASLSDSLLVTGKNNIIIKAELTFSELTDDDYDLLVIPGGTMAYLEHQAFLTWVTNFNRDDKLLAAICAAPTVFGKLGFLHGRRAVCFPGLESWLTGAIVTNAQVETDGRFTTARGPALAVPFGLRLLQLLRGSQAAEQVRRDLLASPAGL